MPVLGPLIAVFFSVVVLKSPGRILAGVDEAVDLLPGEFNLTLMLHTPTIKTPAGRAGHSAFGLAEVAASHSFFSVVDCAKHCVAAISARPGPVRLMSGTTIRSAGKAAARHLPTAIAVVADLHSDHRTRRTLAIPGRPPGKITTLRLIAGLSGRTSGRCCLDQDAAPAHRAA